MGLFVGVQQQSAGQTLMTSLADRQPPETGIMRLSSRRQGLIVEKPGAIDAEDGIDHRLQESRKHNTAIDQFEAEKDAGTKSCVSYSIERSRIAEMAGVGIVILGKPPPGAEKAGGWPCIPRLGRRVSCKGRNEKPGAATDGASCTCYWPNFKIIFCKLCRNLRKVAPLGSCSVRFHCGVLESQNLFLCLFQHKNPPNIISHGAWSSITFNSSKSRIIGPTSPPLPPERPSKPSSPSLYPSPPAPPP